MLFVLIPYIFITNMLKNINIKDFYKQYRFIYLLVIILLRDCRVYNYEIIW